MPAWGELPGKAKTLVTDGAGYLRRAARGTGSERDDLVLVVKSVIAAVGAWVMARNLLPATVSTFAPFTALVAVQATVYRSVRDCVQYLVAMAAGASLAAALAAVAGIEVWAFALLTLIALGVGRIRRFGQQGIQVAIVGFFAFSSGAGRIDYIGHLVASVVIGVACGLAAHLVLAPARHADHRQRAVADLYDGISRRIEGLAGSFERGEPGSQQVRRWRREWEEEAVNCGHIRNSIDSEIENSRLNPRRSVERAAEALPRARDAVTTAERSLEHLRSMTRSLDYALDSEEIHNLPASFRADLGSLLRTVAGVMREIGQAFLNEPAGLDGKLDGAQTELDRMQRQERVLTEAAMSTLHGSLLTDTARLLAELRSGQRTLASSP